MSVSRATTSFSRASPGVSPDLEEMEKNDFNLNISRYISTAVGEEEISLEETNAELVESRTLSRRRRRSTMNS